VNPCSFPPRRPSLVECLNMRLDEALVHQRLIDHRVFEDERFVQYVRSDVTV